MQLSALRPTYVKPRASMKTRLTGFKVGSARQLRRGSKLEPTLVHPQPRAVLGDVAKGGPGRCCQFRRAPEDCRAPVTRVGRLFRRAPKAPASTVRVIPTPATPILRHYVAVVPIPGRLRTAPLHDEPGRRTMAGSAYSNRPPCSLAPEVATRQSLRHLHPRYAAVPPAQAVRR